MPKDKQGNQLTWKEYLQRWKRGIEGVTPLQQTNIQIKGTYIIILGLCAGIFISILGFKNLWWLMLILIEFNITIPIAVACSNAITNVILPMSS